MFNEPILEEPRILNITLSERNVKLLYNYKKKGGINNILISTASDFVSFLAIVSVTIFITTCIDLDIIETTSSANLTEYIYFHPHPISYLLAILVGCIVIAYTSAKLYDIYKYLIIYTYYLVNLGISQQELDKYNWRDISQRIIDICPETVGELSSPLDIHQLNYMLVKEDNLIISILPKFKLRTTLPMLNKKVKINFFTQTTYNTVRLFHKYVRIHPNKHISYFLGSLSVVLMPLILICALVYNGYRYIQQISSDAKPKMNLFCKEWNWYAKFYFRKENELPHITEYKLARAYNTMIKFSANVASNSKKTRVIPSLALVFGCLLSLFVVIGAYSDTLLWNIRFFNHSLVTYMSICVVVLKVLYSMLPEKYHIPRPGKYYNKLIDILEINSDLENPGGNSRPGNQISSDTEKDIFIDGLPKKYMLQYVYFGQFFEYKWCIMMKEYLSILCLPYVFFVIIPRMN